MFNTPSSRALRRINRRGSADLSLFSGTIQSEKTGSESFKLSLKDNTGAQVKRIYINGGFSTTNTQISFLAGEVQFNLANCTGLSNVTPVAAGTKTLGSVTLPWASVYSTTIIGGDDPNGTAFEIQVMDANGSAVPLLSVPLTASPQTATWACRMDFTGGVVSMPSLVSWEDAELFYEDDAVFYS